MAADDDVWNARAARRAVRILRAGPLTTIQDLGRPGFAHLGVGRGGAADRASFLLANRAVGNHPHNAAFETTAGGMALQALCPLTVAVCGAVAPVRVDGRPAAWCAPIRLGAGCVLDVGPAVVGVRCYIAVDGGVAVAPVLGSRSTDLLAGLGPPVPRDGEELPVGPTQDRAECGAADFLPFRAPQSDLELPLIAGPRPALFAPDAWDVLAVAEYVVTSASNRIALRLDGPAVRRAGAGADVEPSEGAVLGAVQVPVAGQPIIFLADHPPTGGYPVLGVVPAASLDLCAQAAPGDRVRFRSLGPRR